MKISIINFLIFNFTFLNFLFFRLLTPLDIEQFIHKQQKAYTTLYERVHNRSGEHDRSAWYYVGGDEKGSNGKPPDYEAYYFYVNVRECTGLHDVISLGIPADSLTLSTNTRKKARISPTILMLEKMQKTDAKMDTAVESIATSMMESNLTTYKVSLFNEKEALEKSMSTFESEHLNFLIKYSEEIAKTNGNKKLIKAYKKLMNKASARVKEKKKAIKEVSIQLDELKSKMKMNKFQIDKGKTLDMEIIDCTDKGKDGAIEHSVDRYASDNMETTDCVDYRKDEAIEHYVDSDSDSDSDDSDESDSSVSSSDSSNSSSSEEDKKRKAF